MPYYAVAQGQTVGIFSTWPECSESVKGYKGAIYKKFDTKSLAEQFLKDNYREPEPVSNSTVFETKNTDIGSPRMDSKPEPAYYVYTDGACSNNGRDNAEAGIGIYFGPNDPRNMSKRIDGKQTNNAAELTAILETFPLIQPDLANGQIIAIATDSEYALKCVSSYGEKCSKAGWKKEIPNKELVKQVYELYSNQPHIQFIHIRAHTQKEDVHSVGNENADRLANQAIGLQSCPYASTKHYTH